MIIYYTVSNYFSVCVSLSPSGFRQWLQANFQIGIPVFWGRYGTIIPLKTDLQMEIGRALEVKQKSKEAITQADIDAVHEEFMKRMEELFERTKLKHGCRADQKLTIL
jgi:Diacylglycerol acyltransferase